MSIESIAGLKGLGGSFPLSRGSASGQQQDGLLRDTARELEQLFDEFQSLRSSITAEPDLPSPPRAYVPPLSESFLQPATTVEQSLSQGSPEPVHEHTELLTELSLRDREINSMRQNQQDKDQLLRAHDAKTARLEAELREARDQIRLQQRKQQTMKDSNSWRDKQRTELAKQHANNIKVAREMELDKAHELTKQAPILEVLNTLESDGAAKQRQIDEMQNELKSLQKMAREKDKVIEQQTAEIIQLKDRPDTSESLQNDVKMLLHTIEGLQSENKTLGRLEAEKSAVIEELTAQIEAQADNDYKLVEQQNEIQAANIQNKELMHEIHTLQLAEQKRTKRLLKEESTDDILSAKEWMDERRQLRANVQKANEKLQEAEKTLRAQDTRVNTLTSRLSSITSVVKESKVRRLPSSIPDEPGADVVAEVGEMHPRDEVEPEMWVPAAMYSFLEQELRVLRADVEEKTSMLQEKDELVESLERKVEVLSKARAAESSRGQREISKLTSELEKTRASFVKHGTPRALQASQKSALQACSTLTTKRRGSTASNA